MSNNPIYCNISNACSCKLPLNVIRAEGIATCHLPIATTTMASRPGSTGGVSVEDVIAICGGLGAFMLLVGMLLYVR